MHKRAKSKSIHSPHAWRLMLLGGLMLAMLVAPPLLRSQTMFETPTSPNSDWATHERLKKLVPERVGKWKLFGTGPEPMRIDGFQPSGVLAEFRLGKRRAKVKVGQIAARPIPASSAVMENNSAAGSEKTYVEAGALVNETHRVADGRTEIQVSRADGVTVNAQAHGVPASELKAIAMAIKSGVP
jgi:hypothetical protein